MGSLLRRYGTTIFSGTHIRKYRQLIATVNPFFPYPLFSVHIDLATLVETLVV